MDGGVTIPQAASKPTIRFHPLSPAPALPVEPIVLHATLGVGVLGDCRATVRGEFLVDGFPPCQLMSPYRPSTVIARWASQYSRSENLGGGSKVRRVSRVDCRLSIASTSMVSPADTRYQEPALSTSPSGRATTIGPAEGQFDDPALLDAGGRLILTGGSVSQARGHSDYYLAPEYAEAVEYLRAATHPPAGQIELQMAD